MVKVAEPFIVVVLPKVVLLKEGLLVVAYEDRVEEREDVVTRFEPKYRFQVVPLQDQEVPPEVNISFVDGLEGKLIAILFTRYTGKMDELHLLPLVLLFRHTVVENKNLFHFLF